jgi:1,4-dihydroxy-2-naphthoate polyprenyltransferase
VLAAFARLSRLKFLVGSLLGGGLGTAVAAYERGAVDWRTYALAQSAITVLHLMTHYANDFFDRDADALAKRTPFSGGSGTLVDGSLQPGVALAAAGVCLAFGLGGTAVLAVTGKPLAAAFALAIAAFAWAYSAPPLRLLGRGLGEADTALIVAVLVPLCAYAAQTETVGTRIVASTLPAAAAMFAMMLAVEYPDVAADGATGKRNLVVRAGLVRARVLVGAALWAGLLGIGIALLAGAPWTFAALLGPAVPVALGLQAALKQRAWMQPDGPQEIAARGVTLFFVVSFCSLLGYLTALP